jgi:nucleotide-binding universal stress UspA family protein
MMRILLATDGSESASNAVETVRNLALPAGSVIRLVAVLPSTPELFGAAWDAYVPGDAEAIERQMVGELEAALDGVKANLERPGVTVEEEVLRGRAATQIVEAANAFRADLVVVGSRGMSAWKRLLLGSVSAEIVDNARSPVLVARRPSVGRVVLGDDGSEGSRAAALLLARFPALAGEGVRVVAVAEVLSATALGFSPAVSGAFMTEMIETTAEADERLAEVTRVTAAILGNAGIATDTEVRSGDPAHELVTAARAIEAGLVVVGTTGLTGVARAVLGSVARNVLINARCSVLIVHPPQREAGS